MLRQPIFAVTVISILVVLAPVTTGAAVAPLALSDSIGAIDEHNNTSDLVDFNNTTTLDANQTNPDSLAGNITVESAYANHTSVTRVKNSPLNYSLSLSVASNASNVTFYLVSDRVENASNATLFVGGQQAAFDSTQVNNTTWLGFNVEDFSNGTQTVSFVQDAQDGVGNQSAKLANFTNTTALDSNQTIPDSLAGNVTVESAHANDTFVTLVNDTPVNYSLSLSVAPNASNVTFYLVSDRVENASNATLFVGDQQAAFVPIDANNTTWLGFNVENFSNGTQTVSFVQDSEDGIGNQSADLAAFTNTTSLDENRTDPDDLAGKIRVETDYLNDTSIELTRNSSTNYSLAISVTGNATNVTFYLQGRAISSSQNISNVTMYLDGEEHDFVVDEDAGPGKSPWVGFNVPHFSTRTVSFVAENETGDNATVSVGNATGSPGDEITVPVSADANDVASYQLNVSFPPSALEFVGATGTDDFGAPNVEYDNESGWVFTNQSKAQGNDTPQLVELTFRIADDAEGGQDLALAVIEQDSNISNSSGSLIPASFVNGTVMVEETLELANFTNTTSLDANQTDPASLAGKIRVESQYVNDTTIELTRNSSADYRIAITVTGNATNVTFYLQERAISSSQNISNVTMYLDGEEHDFVVDEDAGPGNSPWVGFNVPHFSTRTVAFTSCDTGDANGDGDVTSGDATLVLRTVVGLTDPDELTACGDFNEDGSLSSGDATLVLRKVVGLE